MPVPQDVNIGVNIQIEDIDWGSVDVKQVGKDLEQKLLPLKQNIKEIFQNAKMMDPKNVTGKMASSLSRLQSAYNRLTAAQRRYNDIVNESGKNTDAYKEAEQRLKKRISYIKDALDDYKDKGFDNKTSPFGTATISIEGKPVTKTFQDWYNYVKDLQEQQRNLNPVDFIGQVPPEEQERIDQAYRNVGAAATSAENAQQAYNRALQESMGPLGRLLPLLEQLMRKFGASSEQINKALGTFGRIAQTVNKVGSAFSNIGKSLKKFSSVASKFIKSFKKDTEKGFNGALRALLRYGFGVRSLYFLIRRLRTAVIEQFKEMAKQIPEINTQVSAFMTALNQLKGSTATAFQPIISVVLPTLTSFINKLAEAMNVVARFFAVLTGQNKIFKYTAKQVDYAADSMKKGSGAANDYKNQLLGFDEINRLNDNNSGSGGSSDDDTDGTWVEEPITAANKLAELMKQGWAISDFTEVGIYIGEWLKGALNTAIQYIQNEIAPFVNKLALVIATGINGFISVDGLAEKLGELIGVSLNTAVNGQYLFSRNVDWNGLSNFITAGVQTALDNLNLEDLSGETFWTKLGTVLGNKITFYTELISDLLTKGLPALAQGLSDGIESLLQTVHDFIVLRLQAFDLGASIAQALSNIAWGDIVLKVCEIAVDLIKKIFEFVSGLLINLDWAKLIYDIITILGGLVGLLFGGIGEILRGLFELIIGLVISLLMNIPGMLLEAAASVVKLLSELFYSMGLDTWAGFLEGLVADIHKVKEWLRTNLVDPFVKFFKELFGINSPSKVMSEIGTYIIEGLVEGLEEKFNSISQFIDKIKDLFNRLIDFFNVDFATKWSNAWNSIVEKFGQIWNKITDKVKGPINSAISWVNSFLADVESAFNNIADRISSLSFDIPDFVPLIGGTSFQISMPRAYLGRIPALAQGAVIPPNKQFLALLGDQRNGTNIEAPLSTIQQAVADVIGGDGMYDLIVSAIESALENRPNPTIENKLYLDSRQIKIGQDRLARAMGT